MLCLYFCSVLIKEITAIWKYISLIPVSVCWGRQHLRLPGDWERTVWAAKCCNFVTLEADSWIGNASEAPGHQLDSDFSSSPPLSNPLHLWSICQCRHAVHGSKARWIWGAWILRLYCRKVLAKLQKCSYVNSYQCLKLQKWEGGFWSTSCLQKLLA